MPPKKPTTRKQLTKSDDESDDSPTVALDPKVADVGDMEPILSRVDLIEKRLDERVEKIRADYLAKVDGVRKKAKGCIAALSTKLNHARDRDLKRLVELLNQRQMTQSEIATKLTGLEKELNSFRRCFESGYNGVEKRAAELSAMDIVQHDASEEAVQQKRRKVGVL